jgi:hypothetical protein
MIADGLTKILPIGKWKDFIQKPGLQDVSNLVLRRKFQELEEDSLK